jgi:hypothetical protein
MMIADVPKHPAPPIAGSWIRMVQDCVEVFLRKIAENCPNFAPGPKGHSLRKEQFRVVRRIVRSLEPHHPPREFLKI